MIRYTLLMACDEYKALLPEHAEGRLSVEQERLLKDHLRDCDSCRSTLRLLRMDDKAIRGALLGLRPKGIGGPEPRRGVRVLLIGTVLVLLMLAALYGAYRGLGWVVKDDSGPWGDLPPAEHGDTAGDLEAMITWDDVLLDELRPAIAKATGFSVVMDPPSLDALLTAVPGKRPLSGHAGKVFREALRPLGLAFDVRFGVIFIASPERLASLPVTAPSLPPALASKSVTLSFSGLPLSEALDTLARLKGIEIVLSSRIAEQVAAGRVTLAFRGVGLPDALALLLAPRGLTFAFSGGMVVVRRAEK